LPDSPPIYRAFHAIRCAENAQKKRTNFDNDCAANIGDVSIEPVVVARWRFVAGRAIKQESMAASAV